MNKANMDIDFILNMGWSSFVRAIHSSINKQIKNTNKDLIIKSVSDWSLAEIIDLSSALRLGGAVYSNVEIKDEERYHEFRMVFSSILWGNKQKMYKFIEQQESYSTPFLSTTSLYIGNASLQKRKALFREAICFTLEVEEESIQGILNEIKYLWEYEHIIYILDIFKNDQNIASLEKRDRKKEYQKKVRFVKRKEKVLEFFKDYDIDITYLTELKELDYSNSTQEDEFIFYEPTLKAVKKLLYHSLITSYGTGKIRAKEISKIIEDI